MHTHTHTHTHNWESKFVEKIPNSKQQNLNQNNIILQVSFQTDKFFKISNITSILSDWPNFLKLVTPDFD